MAEIRIIPRGREFDKVMTILQASCGCIVTSDGDLVIIYTFNDDDILVSATLKLETESEIISLRRLGV